MLSYMTSIACFQQSKTYSLRFFKTTFKVCVYTTILNVCEFLIEVTLYIKTEVILD